MANQLLLPPQKFSYKEITDQFPKTGNPKKKVFFQAELRSLANGDASFGIIAYAAWKDSGKWVIGSKKVSGTDAGVAIPVLFIPPVAFANNEIVVSFKMAKQVKKAKKKSKTKEPKKGRWNEFAKLTRKLSKDKKLLAQSYLLFKTTITDNPHLEYNVTLEVNGTSLNVSTKPSPPAPPEA